MEEGIHRRYSLGSYSTDYSFKLLAPVFTRLPRAEKNESVRVNGEKGANTNTGNTE